MARFRMVQPLVQGVYTIGGDAPGWGLIHELNGSKRGPTKPRAS